MVSEMKEENDEEENENLTKEEMVNANDGGVEISDLSLLEEFPLSEKDDVVQQLPSASSSDSGLSTSSSHYKEEDHPQFRSSQNTHVTEFSGSLRYAASGGSITSDDESEPQAKATTRKQPSGFVQILALLRKNLLTRYRTPTGTFFELFSPLLMLLVLASAYTLSEITNKDAKMYSSITLDIPGPWLDLVRSSSSILSNRERRDIRSRQLRRQEEQYSTEEWDGETDWNDIFTGLQDKVHRQLLDNMVEVPGEEQHRRKLQFTDDDNLDDSAEEDDSDIGDVFDLLDEARRQVRHGVDHLHYLLDWKDTSNTFALIPHCRRIRLRRSCRARFRSHHFLNTSGHPQPSPVLLEWTISLASFQIPPSDVNGGTSLPWEQFICLQTTPPRSPLWIT